MRINIYFDFKEGVWGGANQFLKALRDEWIKKNVFTDNLSEAHAIVINSYHKINKLIPVLFTRRDIFLIHRLGPLFFYHRGMLWKLYDRFIIRFTNAFADGVIFQSRWSYEEAIKLGLEKSLKKAIIYNAPDNSIFTDFPRSRRQARKFQIIATSNSNNWEKGFRYFQFLDRHLDFSHYEMLFIGRSPIQFENIRHIEPQDSKRLADILRDGDLYLSPVCNEACSNAILEALSCGLPVLALDNSSNPEIIGAAGELFSNEQELLEKIQKIERNHATYRQHIVKPDIQKIATQYEDFIRGITAAESPREKSRILLLLYGIYHFIIKITIILIGRFVSKKSPATPI